MIGIGNYVIDCVICSNSSGKNFRKTSNTGLGAINKSLEVAEHVRENHKDKDVSGNVRIRKEKKEGVFK